jgi:predicted Rossmann-fold nucleotide-binding protein
MVKTEEMHRKKRSIANKAHRTIAFTQPGGYGEMPEIKWQVFHKIYTAMDQLQ